jgi:arginine repressor
MVLPALRFAGLEKRRPDPMKDVMVRCKTLQWLIPVATAIGPAQDIAEAFGRFGDGTILALAAAANALTVIP